MKKVGFFLFFTFLFTVFSTPSLTAEKAKSEKIHISGKTIFDGKPFPGAELYLQTIDWVDGHAVEKLKKIGSSGKDGSFSVDLEKNNRQVFRIIALENCKAMGWVGIYEKTINEGADISMNPLDSSFSGIVTDNDGSPLSDVKVRISGMVVNSLTFNTEQLEINSPIPGTHTKTDNNGRFSFDNIPGNAALGLIFDLEGYVYHDSGHFNFKSGNQNAEIKLYPEGIIEGRVVYSGSDKPVAGVTVSCSGQRSKTDKKGFYRISKLNEGNHTVSLSLNKPEYDGFSAEKKENIGVDYGKITEVNIEFKKGILLTGTVTEKISGKPADGVTISISGRQTVTGKDGVYKLCVLPGEFEIVAFGDSYSEYSGIYNMGENVKYVSVSEADTLKEVNLTVEKKVKITGIVRYPDGRPAKKAMVYFFVPRSFYSDMEGKFTDMLEGKAMGKKISYIADIPSEELEGTAEIDAVEGGYGEIILHPYEYIKVNGKTVDKNNNPVPGVKISLIRSEGMSSIERDSTAVSDENGDFSVEKLRERRRYIISAYDSQICSPVIDTGKTVQSEPYILVIPDSTHSIWGKITDESGAPVPEVELYMWFSNGHKQTLSDSLGYYHFDGIINSFHEISIKSQKFGRDSFRNLVMDSENNLILRDKNRWLNGYVYDKDGKPLAGINVSTQLTPSYPWLDFIKTDTNGKFRLRGLRADTVDLQIYEDRTIPKQCPLNIPGAQQAKVSDLLKAPEPFRQEFKGIKTNQEIILKTKK